MGSSHESVTCRIKFYKQHFFFLFPLFFLAECAFELSRNIIIKVAQKSRLVIIIL